MAQYDLSELAPNPHYQWLLEKLQEVLAESVSTTIEGNRLTLAWNQRGKLLTVNCILLSVDDGVEPLTEPMDDPAEQATEP
jgi:hypothetical protein